MSTPLVKEWKPSKRNPTASVSSAADCEVHELDLRVGQQRRRFVQLPFDLAADVAAWRPGVRRFYDQLMHPRRNPFWQDRRAAFFVVLRGGRLVGRIGVVEPGCIPQRPEAATMVMPDFIDDETVVQQLLNAASTRSRELGARELIGPFNPNIHHDVGVQVSGFDQRNTIFMGYQPAYYARLLESHGMVPLAGFQAWSLHEPDFLRTGRLHDLVQRVERKPSLRIRGADRTRFHQELRIFHSLYSKSFADHWGFVAPTWDEFQFIAGDVRLLLKDGMAIIAEWNGQPVGFVLSIPDLYGILPKSSGGRITPAFLIKTLWRWRQLDQVRVMIAGVLPSHRRFGIHLPLFYRMARNIFELGFRGGEISWVMDDNLPMLKVLPLLGARRTKRYRLYARQLA